MKFLRNDDSSNSKEKKIVVQSVIKKSLDCSMCGQYVEMEGGAVDDEWAKFMCPQCGTINKIKWGSSLE